MITNKDIEILKNRYELNIFLISVFPEHKDYLKMEDDLKILENQINDCSDILVRNELVEKKVQLLIKILEHVHISTTL